MSPFIIGRKIPRFCRPQIAALRDSVLDKLAKPVCPRPRVLLPESRPPYVPNRKNIPANGAEPGSKSRFQFRCWRDAPSTRPALRRESQTGDRCDDYQRSPDMARLEEWWNFPNCAGKTHHGKNQRLRDELPTN